MDPFSTTTAAIGLIGDVVSLVTYLREVKAAIDTIDDDIDGLIQELEALEKVQGQLRDECNRQSQRPSAGGALQGLWSYADHTMRLTDDSINKFRTELQGIYGANPKQQGLLDAYRKQHRLKAKISKFKGWREAISQYNGLLQTLLQMILMINQDHAREDASQRLENLQQSFSSLETRLEEMYLQRKSTFDPITYASFLKAASIPEKSIKASLNRPEREKRNLHFDIPQPVDSSYVGRGEESQILAKCFFQQADDQHQQQMRFVVYGVGGSGKTQFCCKFAQDYQYLFWGVFWIDGRSHDQLKQTLAKNVALVGGVDPNYHAALHWLSNQDKRWLLIIDNADNPAIDLHEYFPRGGKGYVLITTRNPSFTRLGNISPGHLEFKGMRPSDATNLLFKTSGYPPSLAAELGPVPGKIVDTLGYLALAISVAGSAIREGVCRFQDYLKYYEEISKERFRSLRRTSIKPSDDFEEKREPSVESTFDISTKAIKDKNSRESRDALQLLQTFAFMHCENVQFAFLRECVENLRKEEEVEAASQKRTITSKQTWRQFFQEQLIRLLTAPGQVSAPTTLPDVLRQGRAEKKIDEIRVRAAMKQLTQYSLVMYKSKTDSWSMHPLVHRWARDSLSLSIAEQYVWCECAATLLSSCVVIGSDNSDELMRHLLPHVDEVRARQGVLEERTRHERMARLKPWPIFEAGFSPQRARMMAKFSIVYAQNGLFGKAESLQRAVQRFTVDVLGFGDPKTRRITMALADTLWRLGLSDESARLLEVLLDSCLKALGPDDPDTYVAKRRLAHSRMMQGRVNDAKRLYEDALPGLKKLRGLEDEETLETMDGFALTVLMSGTPAAIREARGIHKQTWDIKQRVFGPRHLKTLESSEKYYVAAWWHATPDELAEAVQGLKQIIEIRTAVLGRENPYTLLAELNLARINVELQDYDAAEALFSAGLSIAERNLGPDHVGVLYGRYHFGRMRVRQARFKEARSILVDTTERQRSSLQGWGRFHYDRISALLELAKAHQELGEYEECDESVAEAIRGFQKITTKEHPWHQKLLTEWEEWKSRRPPSSVPLSSAQVVPAVR